MDKPYSKRELDDHFGTVKTSFKTVNTKLDEISTNVKNTNGRVKQLEMWRFGMVMSGSVITFAVIPLIMFIYFDKVNNIEKNIDTTVQASINEVLFK